MKMEIRGKNVEVTEALKDYTEKRISKLAKYFEEIRTAHVTMSLEGEGQKVEVTIPLNGVILRGEETTEDMYMSVDMVLDKLEKQIEKFRSKLINRHRGTGLKKAPAVAVEGTKEKELEYRFVDDQFRVVKTKRFALKPMDEEEAIMQMNLLGHNFFVFFNAGSDEVNVVYKRNDGDYGLIEPDFD